MCDCACSSYTKHFVRVLLVDHFSRRQLYVVTPVVLARFNLVGIVSNAGQSKVFKVLPCACDRVHWLNHCNSHVSISNCSLSDKDAPRETMGNYGQLKGQPAIQRQLRWSARSTRSLPSEEPLSQGENWYFVLSQNELQNWSLDKKFDESSHVPTSSQDVGRYYCLGD